ncbi:MAG: hypothetical protein VYA69_06025 [Gemmatimonadota bacterium]|nr:hypothetical protein [Gemmatimonadota bacterium]
MSCVFAFLGKLKRNLNSGSNTIRFGKIAEESRARGDVKKALKLCRGGVDKYPTYATGHVILARCYLAEGRNTEAKESLAEALCLDPHHISVLSELAGMYQLENNNSQALYYYRQALAVDPLNTRIAFLVKSLSGEEPLVAESAPAVEPVVDAVEDTPVIENAETEAEQPSTGEVVDVATVEEEIQSTEEPPATVVEPEAPVVTETVDIAVPETVSAIAPAAVACGPWVAELLQDYLPALAKESRQEKSAEEPWPAVAFNAVLDLGRPSDAVSFGTTATTSQQEETVSTVVDEEPPDVPSEAVIEAPVSEVLESSVFLRDKTDDEPVEVVNEGVEEPNVSEDEPAVEAEEAPVDLVETEPEQAHALDQVSKDNYLDQFFSGVAAAVGPPRTCKNTAPEAPITEGLPLREQASEPTEKTDPDPTAQDNVPSKNDDSVSCPEALKVRGEAPPIEGTRAQIDDNEESKDRDPGEAQEDALSEAIPTATLAELYVQQGLIDRAISVYLTLKKHDPTNPDTHTRLSELFVTKSQRER